MDLGKVHSYSVDDCGQPSGLIVAQGLESFKLHVSSLQLPLVVLLEQERTDEPRDGRWLAGSIRVANIASELATTPAGSMARRIYRPGRQPVDFVSFLFKRSYVERVSKASPGRMQ
jgi:hypothetical protein